MRRPHVESDNKDEQEMKQREKGMEMERSAARERKRWSIVIPRRRTAGERGKYWWTSRHCTRQRSGVFQPTPRTHPTIRPTVPTTRPSTATSSVECETASLAGVLHSRPLQGQTMESPATHTFSLPVDGFYGPVSPAPQPHPHRRIIQRRLRMFPARRTL